MLYSAIFIEMTAVEYFIRFNLKNSGQKLFYKATLLKRVPYIIVAQGETFYIVIAVRLDLTKTIQGKNTVPS